MATRPTDGFPRFARNDVTLPDGTNNKVPLRSNIEDEGYTINDLPNVQELNYILDKVDRWVEYLDEAVGDVNQGSFPVNSIYLSTVNTNPATSLGFGTWSLVGEGRFLVGVGTGTDENGVDRQFTSGDNSNGEYQVTLTEQQIPRHNHTLTTNTAQDAGVGGVDSASINSNTGTVTSTDVGNDQPHNNTPPSFGAYMWQRTA